jgi:hypothetical protein
MTGRFSVAVLFARNSSYPIVMFGRVKMSTLSASFRRPAAYNGIPAGIDSAG